MKSVEVIVHFRLLQKKGIHCFNEQDGSQLTEDCDLFVYSQAIPLTSPERRKAQEMNIRSLSYFEALGELTRGKKTVCIAGTHGKSSTTAMIAKMCIDAGLDPNVVLGTKAMDMNRKNWRAGKSDLWVLEACEYQKQFLALTPTILVITNADGDHFDAFKDQNDYEDTFLQLAKKVPEDGAIAIHGNDKITSSITQKSEKTVIDADREETPIVGVPGKHMQENGALAREVGRMLGIDDEVIHGSLAAFRGTWRRMEVRGEIQEDVLLIDDYAHHPIEITATLSALKEHYSDRRIVCAFQPHTHDRTFKLWQGFVESLSLADVLLLVPVYDARPDRESREVNLEDFQNDIEGYSQKKPLIATSLKNVAELLRHIVQEGDIVITMGAGTITEVADMMMSA
jgi:UDP-N-acetylmuramate--alanine ligase